MPGRNATPNILIINADQQRFDCLGCTGNPIVKTPNIDALRSRGMLFTNAFTPVPLCTPARQTLLCGVMPEVHGGLWNYDGGSRIGALNPDRDIWVRRLKEFGYQTGYVGKWHVHGDVGPTGFGFDQHLGPGEVPLLAGEVGEMHPARQPLGDLQAVPCGHEDDSIMQGLRRLKGFGTGKYDAAPLDQTHTHRLADEAIRCIQALAARCRPWHVRLDFPQPHLPCVPAEPFASMYPPSAIPPWGNFPDPFDGKPAIQRIMLENWRIEDWTWNEWSVYMSSYYGIISQYDDAIGRVMKALSELEVLGETLIIYTSDHGDAAGSHGMMDKHYVMYEEVVRVPLVMRWDGVIEPGSARDDFISHYLDLGPTLLDLLGMDTPSEYQGLSFLPQLEGRPNQNPRDAIFSSYHGQQCGLYTQRMLRDRRYKLVFNATDRDEFYDLDMDPHELRNLANLPEHREQVDGYRKRLWETFDALGDTMLRNPRMKRRLRADA